MRFTLQRMGLVTCALLSACGGSSGPASGSVALLSGTYFFAALGGSRVDVPAWDRMTAGDLVADGAGNATATTTLVNEDSVLGTESPLALTYTVGADSSFTLSDGGTPVMTGGLASAGDVAVGANLTAGDSPQLLLMVKSTGAFGNASLSGDYHLVYVAPSPVGAQKTAVQAVSFDGVGGILNSALPGSSNESGSVTPLPMFLTVGTYSVAANGRVIVDGGDAMGHYTGTVLAGGSFAVLAGDTVAGVSGPRMIVLVKVGAGLTNATLQGDYWAANVTFNDATRTQWTCGTGVYTFDGAGGLPSLSFTRNSEGTIASSGGADDYSVSPNGTLLVGDVTGAMGGPYVRGAVSADGRFAVFGGSIAATQAPLLYVLVRK